MFAKGLSVSFVIALLTAAAVAQGARLVRDINLTGATETSSNPAGFTDVGGETYFVADWPGTGGEVVRWSPGTGAATLVVDPSTSLFSSRARELSELSGLAVFIADALVGVHVLSADPSLWVADPLTGNAQRLSFTVAPSGPLVKAGGLLFFSGNGDLWRTDGTPRGTQMVADLFPQERVALGSELVFSAVDGGGPGLWRTDGTANGTELVQRFANRPRPFAAAGGLVFMAATDPQTGASLGLWVTDGTSAGTREIAGPFLDIQRARGQWSVQGTTLYVVCDDGVTGEEIWRSDGSAAGTAVVRDIAPGGASSFPTGLTAVGSDVMFAVGGARELWRTDGSAAGTVRVVSTATVAVCADGVAWRGRYYFGGTDAAAGCELWASDGTAVGTVRVADIVAGPTGSSPTNLALVAGGSRLAFSCDDGVSGREPWVSDGTAMGTRRMANIGLTNAGSSPRELVDLYGTTVFSADDGVAGRELWRSDGTTAGTVRVKDIRVGSVGSAPDGLFVAGDAVFFAADDGGGRRLWKSDGSPTGTVAVHSVLPSTGAGAVAVGRELFFVGDDGRSGTELWASDGTASGTRLVLDLTPGAAGTDLRIIGAVGARALFVVDAGMTELWSTNGTASGTRYLADTVASVPRAELGGVLYFAGTTPSTGTELWGTDGTVVGTRMVVDLVAGSGSSNPTELAATDGLLLFSAWTSGFGEELWASDGTARGTGLVLDIVPGPNSGSPRGLTAAGEFVAFTRSIGSTVDIWLSDGTASGTTLVRDRWFSVVGLTAVGARQIYFAGDSANPAPSYVSYLGGEPWRVTAAAGVELVADIAPTFATSTPTGMTLSSGALLFGADDATRGRELWLVEPGATSQPVGQGCLSGSPALRLWADDPVLGATAFVRGSGARPGTSGALLLGSPRPPTELAPGCSLYLNLEGLVILASLAPTTGDWSLPIPLPLSTALHGVHVGLQAVLGPAPTTLGADLTSSVVWTLAGS